jgi:hypothetical protein
MMAAEINLDTVERRSLSAKKMQQRNTDFGRRPKRELRLKLRIQTPKLLFGVCRAIEIYESRAAWGFNIYIYNVVPNDSPIFSMAKNGDIVGIQQLFSAGRASPFDRNLSGETVLDVSSRHIIMRTKSPTIIQLIEFSGPQAIGS